MNKTIADLVDEWIDKELKAGISKERLDGVRFVKGGAVGILKVTKKGFHLDVHFGNVVNFDTDTESLFLLQVGEQQ